MRSFRSCNSAEELKLGRFFGGAHGMRARLEADVVTSANGGPENKQRYCLSGLRSADDPADIPYVDAGRYLPAVGLMRIRELVARYPEYEAEPEFGG